MSTDDAETLKKFRESLKSKDTFVADPDAALTKRYDVKAPLINIANRNTFVIGKGRKVEAVVSGSDAIDPEHSVRACTLPKRSAPDAGSLPVDSSFFRPDAGTVRRDGGSSK